MKKHLLISFLFTVILIFSNLISVAGQTPSPSSAGPAIRNPNVAAQANFADYLEDLIMYSALARKSFISDITTSLGGYFNLISFSLAWIVMLYSFLRTANTEGWDQNIAAKSMVRFAVCTFLIAAAPTIITQLSEGGKTLAHDTSYSNYSIASLVREQDKTFDENYKKFVQSKLMVSINGKDFPVQYDSNGDSVKTLAALYIGRMTPEQQKAVESEAWWIGTSFTVLNGLRGAIGAVDIFLYWLEGFLIITALLVSPFMASVGIDKELYSRMSKNFLWSLFVVTLVYPIVTQAARFIGFWFANLAIGGENSFQFYTWDSTQNMIVAHGEPLYIVGVAIACFAICIFLLLFSLGFSYKLMQGAVLEAIGSAVSSAFTSLASVGIQTVVGAKAAQLNTQAENEQIASQYAQSVVSAEGNKEIASLRAKTALESAGIMTGAQFDAKVAEAEAKKLAAEQNLQGSYINSAVGLGAEKFNSTQNAIASTRKEIENLNADQKKEMSTNFLDYMKAQKEGVDRNMIDRIEKSPQEQELLADQMTQYFKGVPFAGDKEWMNTMMSTFAGRWLLGKFEQQPDGSWTTKIPDGSKTFGDVLAERGGKQEADFLGLYQQDNGSYLGILGDKGTNLAEKYDAKNIEKIGQEMYQSGGSIPQGNIPNVPLPSSLPKKMNSEMQKNYKNLQALNQREGGQFIPAVQAMSARNGWNSDDFFNLTALETAGTFNKSIRGGGGNNYVGLIQFGPDARKDLNAKFGTPTDVVGFQNHLKNISAVDQLKYVEHYLKQRERGGIKLDSAAKMYAAVGAGSVSSNDQTVLFRDGGFQKGDFGNTRKISNAGYNANRIWDFNGDGKIQQFEFGQAAFKKLGAGQFFTANEAIGKLKEVDPAVRKVNAMRFARDYRIQEESRNNQFYYGNKDLINNQNYDAKRVAANHHLDETIQIANQTYDMKMSGLNQMTDFQGKAIQTTYGGDIHSAKLLRDAGYKQSDHTYKGEIQANVMTYEMQMKLAEMQKESALKAALLRSQSQMVSTIGGSLSHAIGEAPERFNRY